MVSVEEGQGRARIYRRGEEIPRVGLKKIQPKCPTGGFLLVFPVH
jgi:hypothetical protein